MVVQQRSWPRRTLHGAAKCFPIAATLAAGSAVIFGLWSARQFTVRYETLELLPPGAQPFRILHVSDLHLVHGDHKKIEYVRNLRHLAPDFVINTGDNPGGKDAVPDVIRALEPLFEIPGVFVAGSNDYYGPRPANPLRYLTAPTTMDTTKTGQDEMLRDIIDVATMFENFQASGAWHPLGNTSLNMSLRHDVHIRFAGTHDAHLQADVWPGFQPTEQGGIKIAVTHAPYRRVLNAAVADGADLVFAGHTHGGQVALPWYGAVVTNSDLPTGLAAGLFPWYSAGNRGLVNVTAGVGTSPAVPLRTFCAPEATIIDLVAPGHLTT